MFHRRTLALIGGGVVFVAAAWLVFRGVEDGSAGSGWQRPLWPLQQLAGARFGGMEVVVKFPAAPAAAFEPLLMVGRDSDQDLLAIRYAGAARGRLVLVHGQIGEISSPEFDLQPGRARWIQVHVGALYPDADHPWYDTQPPGMSRWRHRVVVTIDGRKMLERDVPAFARGGGRVVLGRRDGFASGGERFSGTVERVRGLHGDRGGLDALRQRAGALQLRLEWPRDQPGATEPLLLTGEPGRSDLLALTRVRDGVFRFSLRHDGAPLTESAEFPWDERRPLELQVTLASLPGVAGPGLVVEADGEMVFSHHFAPHAARLEQVYVGCTPWPVAGVAPWFRGELVAEPVVAEAADAARLRRAQRALFAGRTVEFAFTLSAEQRFSNAPLFTTGVTGRGDGLFLQYHAPGEVRLGWDHWGSQPTLSAPIALRGDEHRVRVGWGAAVRPDATVAGQLRVELDGRLAFETPVEVFPAEPADFFLGANPIGMSTSQGEFPGGVRAAAREPVTNP